MQVPSLVVLAVLGVVVVLRGAFGVGHGAIYLSLNRLFPRTGGWYSAAGKGLSRLALLLPVGGFVASLVGMVASYREKPPGGLRRIVEIPFEVLAGVLFEALLGLAIAGALLGLLWAAGRKGGRGL